MAQGVPDWPRLSSRAGKPAQQALKRVLARTEYDGLVVHLYGVLDNNDVFDYLGGLGSAVEVLNAGNRPRPAWYSMPIQNAWLQSLLKALMQEFRGRHLNPTYLQSPMQHGYAGARTMGSAFVENLWGWQVTTPRGEKLGFG